MKYLSGVNITDFKSIPDHDENSYTFIDDHIGTNEVNDNNFTHLLKLLENKPDRLILEYIRCESVKEYQNSVMMLPVWAIYSAYEINAMVPYTPCGPKYSIFNFIINKDRGNRRRLLEQLIEHNLYTDTYTLCWDSGPGGYPSKYWGNEVPVGQNFIRNNTNENNKNSKIYNAFLRENVFEPSYISIITEPEWFRHDTFITEKTLFAFEAQTLPIWFGGYNIPYYMKDIGFDIFDDIIDHSYQNLIDPYKRMDYSIIKNKHLFENINILEKFYQDNIHRFESNKRLLRENILTGYIDRELIRFNHWPESVKNDIRSIYKRFF
jgi:hypothetical protein